MLRRAICFVVALFTVFAAYPPPARASSPALDPIPGGAVVALAGTTHLWVSSGGLHWLGDTRAAAGHYINWSDRRELTADVLKQYLIGDPWLSAGLVKRGDSISLVKWEAGASSPTLLHIQAIGDVELFGINATNYGALVLDASVWEQRYGFALSSLPTGELAPAIPPKPRLSTKPENLTNKDGTFQWIPAWQEQVQDDRLLWGLILSYTYNQQWRDKIAPYFLANGTRIEWGSLPPTVGGVTYPEQNKIIVNSAVQGDSSGVVAAIVSHETYHATVQHGTGAADCLSEEIFAFTWQAGTWQSIPARWRSSSVWGRDDDYLVSALYAHQLSAMVATSAGYQVQCLGKALPAL